jgi:GWxTD domain-containing protein
MRNSVRALCVAAIGGVVLAACSKASDGTRAPAPARNQTISRPLEIYRDLGFKAGPPQFPAVASFATMAGPADSTYVMLSLSMPSSALRFQRGTAGFAADYAVSLAFLQDTVTVRRLDEKQRVTVATFAETGRTDESVVYQNTIAVPPGRYIVQLQANDANSTRGFRTTDTVDIPAYGETAARIGSPVFVYEADGRANRAARPTLISNPRHTVAYGGESPKLYVETYGVAPEEPVRVNVVDEKGVSIWSADAALPRGDGALRYGVLDIPGENLPLGKMWVEVSAAGTTSNRTPLLLTISDQWMVANFEEVVEFLRYVAYQDELDSLTVGGPVERRAAWESFWARRDPLPATAVNEYRDLFFGRVRYATEMFREPGLLGWKTARGEVYIVLGPPDHAQERWIGDTYNMSGPPNAMEWVYDNVPGGRLTLLFIDRGSFGRYELAASSESAFRATAERIKPRKPR